MPSIVASKYIPILVSINNGHTIKSAVALVANAHTCTYDKKCLHDCPTDGGVSRYLRFVDGVYYYR
jgi:hypothetical protein